MTCELMKSLEELQTDYVDIYMLHRDNLDIPAGEFIDALNEHQKAGRMLAFGASNWTKERYDEANDYAAQHGLRGFIGLSNNFSLAHMLDEPWGGCLTSSDPETREWHEKTQTPLFSWASQGQGFLADGRADPEDRSSEMLVRCWYSDDNFERLRRATELAQKKGVLTINIALAYVLAQSFPTFALVGPVTLEELRTTMPALDINLTAEELAWLDLRC